RPLRDAHSGLGVPWIADALYRTSGPSRRARLASIARRSRASVEPEAPELVDSSATDAGAEDDDAEDDAEDEDEGVLDFPNGRWLQPAIRPTASRERDIASETLNGMMATLVL